MTVEGETSAVRCEMQLKGPRHRRRRDFSLSQELLLSGLSIRDTWFVHISVTPVNVLFAARLHMQ